MKKTKYPVKNEGVILEQKIESGKCYLCQENNKVLAFLGCCENSNGICIHCFLLSVRQMNRCPFCDHEIPNFLKDEIIKYSSKSSSSAKVLEVLIDDKCFICGETKKCLTIYCCWINKNAICDKCAFIFRPHLLEADKCPQCNYAYESKDLTFKFRSISSRESKYFFFNSTSLDPNQKFKCRFCGSGLGQIEGDLCCNNLKQTCVKCFAKAINNEKCPFKNCNKPLSASVLQFLMKNINSFSNFGNPNLEKLKNSKNLKIEPKKKDKEIFKNTPYIVSNTNENNKTTPESSNCIICKSKGDSELDDSCSYNLEHKFHGKCLKEHISNLYMQNKSIDQIVCIQCQNPIKEEFIKKLQPLQYDGLKERSINLKDSSISNASNNKK